MPAAMALSRTELQFDALAEHFHLLQPSLSNFCTIHSLSISPWVLPLENVADFVNFLCRSTPPPEALQLAVEAFHTSLLRGEVDIHELSHSLSAFERPRLIKAYLQLLKAAGQPVLTPPSALFRAAAEGDAQLLAVFGGQGTHNPHCLDDLRDLYSTYRPLVEILIRDASNKLQSLSATHGAKVFERFDLLDWLENPENAPKKSVMASAPISFPINGLIGLCHYCISCGLFGWTPGQMRRFFAGATGHSQGIVAAVVMAASDSWECFNSVSADAVGLLFLIGLQSHSLHQELGYESQSRMLSVRGLDVAALENILKLVNNSFGELEQVQIAIVNSDRSIVVAGSHRALRGVQNLLDHRKAPVDLDQSKIVFTKRRPHIEYTFLPISASFHTPSLEEVTDKVIALLPNSRMAKLRLGVPLYDTNTGLDLQQQSGRQLLRKVISMITTEVVNWKTACLRDNISHIVDFGPGRTSTLLLGQIEGSGTRIIMASEHTESTADYGGKHELFSSSPVYVPEKWSLLYSPSIARNHNHERVLTTRFSKLLKTPPVMVAGMTPTTTSWEFVASIINAGYHAELAAGGYSRKEDLEFAVRQLAASIPADRSIAINMIYANPRQMGWQTELIGQLISEGIPIEGITLGAGVPSPDVAASYIESLGIKYIAFKPGALSAIHSVIDIANTFADFPIVLQWTGGRAGGHHSYEDQYEPLLATYSAIRQCQNITLVVGGGLSDAKGMLPFFTGEWSTTFGYSRMPVDGVLIGSRVMIAKEARTSDKVKELICSLPGTSNEDWTKTYDGPAGGIITVKSEMGEPIHVVANRATQLWKDMDAQIFCISDAKKRLQKLTAMKTAIITRLNQDFYKPWFAMCDKGGAVEIEDLSYAECIRRCLQLMYLSEQSRWVHDSYRLFCGDLFSRIANVLGVTGYPADEPLSLASYFLEECKEAITEILDPEVVDFFVMLCKRRGRKPVNFIPKFDADFETWFKKDSLWQSENLDVVVDQDPQRVFIIYGPVAANCAMTPGEPVGDILGTIVSEISESIDRRTVTVYPASHRYSLNYTHNMNDALKTSDVMVSFASSGAKGIQHALEQAAKAGSEWLHACISKPYIIQDHKRMENPIPGCLKFGPGDILHVSYTPAAKPITVSLLRKDANNGALFTALKLETVNLDNVRVSVGIAPSLTKDAGTVLTVDFKLVGAGENRVLVIETPKLDATIRKFYLACWDIHFNEEENDDFPLLDREFSAPEVMLTRLMRDEFTAMVGSVASPIAGSTELPIDVAIVIAWPCVSKCLLVPAVGGNLSRLLHRSNKFSTHSGAKPLCIGDAVSSTARITRLQVQGSGKLVDVTATVIRNGEKVVSVESAFFIPGKFPQDASMHTTQSLTRLTIENEQLDGLLLSRPWLMTKDDIISLLGKTLDFSLSSRVFQQPGQTHYALEVTGSVSSGNKDIASVVFYASKCSGNPVLDFLRRNGKSLDQKSKLEAPGTLSSEPIVIQISDLGSDYSKFSGDNNPIHTSQPFASFAGHSKPIIHGMYTSAVCKTAVMQKIHSVSNGVVHKWSTSFESKVYGGDALKIEIRHTAMAAGNLVLDVDVFHHETGEKVMKAELEVEQLDSAFLFCGQGSQVQGMGMELYESDSVARAVWDRGDQHLKELYGE